MEKLLQQLRASHDYFTAGFMAEDDPFLGALCCHLDNTPLPEYTDTALYPLSSIWAARGIVNYDYSYSLTLDRSGLEQGELCVGHKAMIASRYDALYQHGSSIEEKYALAGRGYTHFCPELGSFMTQSLTEYLALYYGNTAFGQKMGRLADAVVGYVRRLTEYLATFDTPHARRLVTAYRAFLTGRAESWFDALVRVAFVLALDGYDSLAGVDLCLAPFAPPSDAKQSLSELYRAYESNSAWNFALGEDAAMTALALSSFDGASRPNFSVKVDENTPAFVWEAAFDVMRRGGKPAFYSRTNYRNGLRRLGVREEDLRWLGYGGCTETMVAGKANVGSIDAGINLSVVLDDVLHAQCYGDFDSLMTDYAAAIRKELGTIVHQVNDEMLAMRSRPQYVRTLLCPSCAERELDFSSGGAEYTFSVINLCTLANAADSLYAIRTLVFEQKRFSYRDMLRAIDTDFEEGAAWLEAVGTLCMFGNDNEAVDALAARVFDIACDELSLHRATINDGVFLPACIMFDTALATGRTTPCIPDGRHKGAPVADSGGAMTGRDKTSPTALLNSVARIDPERAVGTWVVNLMLSPRFLRGENACVALRALVLGYFMDGGNQLQINLVDKQTLLDAVDDDALASTILVRVGGFSERFSRLSRDFRRSIADRTEY